MCANFAIYVHAPMLLSVQLVEELSAQVQKLSAALALNRRLQQYSHSLEAGKRFITREERWHRCAPTPPSSSAPMPSPTSSAPMLLPPPSAATASSVSASAEGAAAVMTDLSFASMPHPDAWDQAWVDRVSRLTAHELCSLHKQYAAAAALLYPRWGGCM